MKLVSSIPNVIKGDWSSVVNFADAVQKNINKLAGMKLGPSSSPSFDSLTIDGLTASRLTSTDSDKKLVSTNLYSWIAGTANRVIITDDGDGTVTLSAPQDLHTGATPTFAGATLTGPLNISDSHVTNLGYIDWDLTSDGTVAEGRMFWNNSDGTLNLGMPGGNVNLQIGQEELHRVRNDETSTITNGSVVYISGSTGDVANVKLADASSYTTAYVLGVATENIAASGFGYVTTSGLVRDINTTGLSYGVPLWLGTTPGTFTQSVPDAPNMAVFIGYVVRAHATEGIITVKPTVVPRFSVLSDVYGTADTTGQFSVWDQTNGYFTMTHNINEFQPVDTELSAIAALTPTDSNIIVGDGSTWVAESGATARTSLGLGTTDSPEFTALVLTGTTNPLYAGPWSGCPDPIEAHTNVYQSIYCGNDGANVGRFRIGSNANAGFLQWNRYYDGSANQQMDTTKPSWALNMIGSTDIVTLQRSPAGSTTLATLFSVAGSTGLISGGPAKLGDGGTTNYTEIESDGTLVFKGAATVWNDANVGAMSLALPVAAQPDEVNFLDSTGTDTGITTWGFAVGEKVSGAIDIPHDYKEGSDFTPHVHFQIIAAPAGGTDKAKWQITYGKGREGTVLAAATTITKEIDVTNQYYFYRADFTAITGTNWKMGDQFIFTLSRVAASSDEFAGDLLIATVGLHYECDTVGSRAITTK